jgi:transposase
MTSPIQKLDAAQFDKVASKCRWSAPSLGVARALLVEGKSLPEAAAAFNMKTKQASVYRARFIAKAEAYSLEEFMQRETPKLAISVLEPFSSQLQTLRDGGYTIEQIVGYLKEKGVNTSATTVRNFLKDNRA